MNRITISDLQYHEGDEDKKNIYAKLSISRENLQDSIAIKEIHEPITFDANLSDIIKIQVYTKHWIRRDNFKGGTLGESVESLCDVEGLVFRKLFKHSEEGDTQELSRSIQFKIKVTSASETDDSITDEVTRPFDMNNEKKAAKVHHDTDRKSTEVLDTINDAKTALNNMEVVPWQPLLTKVERFNELMAAVVEVHPYAKLAWSILSAASKFAIGQMNRDGNFQKLISLLDDLFEFLGEASQLKVIGRLTTKEGNNSSDVELRAQIQILMLMSQQVVECAHFVCDYAKSTSFWKRTIKHSISEVDEKVKEYQEIFSRLKASFRDHSVLQTQLSVLQIKFTAISTTSKLDEIAMKMAVNDMVHVIGARYNPDKGCLPNTRVAIIDEIVEWANQPSSSAAGAKIFWLSGVAGSGKSAIAHTVAQQFQSMGRLGSSFCFSVSSQAVQGPQHLFSTLSWELANFDNVWKQELYKVLQANPSISSSYSVMEQFKLLLLGPAQALQITGPIVIVIDGLDESGDPASRKTLLSILAGELAELPSNFYFIVTSRPESDISRALDPCGHVLSKHMEDIGIHSTNLDIFKFIQSSISVENRSLLSEKWRGESWCQLLVDKSEGLFQWASTACLFIESDFYTAVEQLEVLLQPVGDNVHNLASLYTQILDQKTSGGEKSKVDRFVSVMKTVLALKKPLSMSALGKICFQQELSVVKSVLQPLGALLSGISSESTPVQILHTSLHDYLTDKSQSGLYFIDITEEHKNLTFACLGVMKELHFNMCQLPTSYYKNQNIPDLERRIQQGIPTYLSYACIFWADHLRDATFQEAIGTLVSEFMDTKLLYWLEVLSLTRAVDTALGSLKRLVSWLGNRSNFTQTVSLTKDALSFVATYWVVITECAPHIYLSALPLAPEESLVAKQYCGDFRNVLSLQVGKKALWPGGQSVLAGHQGQINSVSFSPDGKYIASGSYDKTIRIWDVKAGKTVVGPILGHTESVTSVLFTHDGQQIISGSYDKTIQVWDAQTGVLRAKPFQGHTHHVSCIASSPDGSYIVSGSKDRTIRIWDMTSENAGKVFAGHHNDPIRAIAFSANGKYVASGAERIKLWDPKTGLEVKISWKDDFKLYIRSLAFSADSLCIVSGSSDGTIRLWDVESGHEVIGLIDGHTGSVLSVAFSPDNKYIASGSADMIVRVWDAHTGKAIGNPLQGHTNWITSVLFSPDGKYIASGSKDKTIRIWNLETDCGVNISTNTGTHSEGHTHVVQSIAISPDGKKIVSGSYDQTIRLWDLETGKAASKVFKGHTAKVKSVAFSPDGNHIASGSNDGTIRIWSASTGLPIGAAYEGHGDYINAVAFSPDGRHIVSGSNDKTLRIWDVETGAMRVGPILGHTKGVRCVAYSPDGKFIVSGSDDKSIRLWDAETGVTTRKILQGHTAWINDVVFSFDGKYIASASADETVRLWDAETCKQVGKSLTGHRKWVTSVAFSPDGEYIISGSNDNTMRIWNTQTQTSSGEPVWGHASRVTSVAVSSDGKHLVSGSADQTVRIWDFQLVLSSLNSQFPLPRTSASPFNKRFKIMDGWVVGPGNRLLFWLPLWNRDIPFYPKNPTVISRNPTVLDYTKFVHGEHWMKCRTPTKSLTT